MGSCLDELQLVSTLPLRGDTWIRDGICCAAVDTEIKCEWYSGERAGVLYIYSSLLSSECKQYSYIYICIPYFSDHKTHHDFFVKHFRKKIMMNVF